MPIYEYNCEKCGIVEAIQKFSDDPYKDCPECGHPGVTKEISASAFHLKGTGWYKTDYASGGSTAGARKAKSESSDSSSADSSTSESKTSSDKSTAKPAKTGCSTDCGCH